MKVFLSWSGDQSHAVARAFNDWLPTVIQSVKPWLSSEHIAKGATWLEEVRKALSESNGLGLFFITRQAIHSEWLLFEAGGIAALDKRRVCTVCIDMPPSELSPPLNFFQATKLEKADVLKLVKDLNSQSAEPLEDRVLQKSFDRAWPDLASVLQEATSNASPDKHPPSKTPSATAAHFDQMMEALRRVELRIGRIEENQGGLQRAIGSAVRSPRVSAVSSDAEADEIARVNKILDASGIGSIDVTGIGDWQRAELISALLGQSKRETDPRNALNSTFHYPVPGSERPFDSKKKEDRKEASNALVPKRR